jgi:hypothetical protein
MNAATTITSTAQASPNRMNNSENTNTNETREQFVQDLFHSGMAQVDETVKFQRMVALQEARQHYGEALTQKCWHLVDLSTSVETKQDPIPEPLVGELISLLESREFYPTDKMELLNTFVHLPIQEFLLQCDPDHPKHAVIPVTIPPQPLTAEEHVAAIEAAHHKKEALQAIVKLAEAKIQERNGTLILEGDERTGFHEQLAKEFEELVQITTLQKERGEQLKLEQERLREEEAKLQAKNQILHLQVQGLAGQAAISLSKQQQQQRQQQQQHPHHHPKQQVSASSTPSNNHSDSSAVRHRAGRRRPRAAIGLTKIQ